MIYQDMKDGKNSSETERDERLDYLGESCGDVDFLKLYSDAQHLYRRYRRSQSETADRDKKLSAVRKEKNEINAKLQKTYDEKRERGIRIQELEKQLDGKALHFTKRVKRKVKHIAGKLSGPKVPDKKADNSVSDEPVTIMYPDEGYTDILSYFNAPDKDIYYYLNDWSPRLPAEVFAEKLSEYDVISFDIFDTAIYRKVHEPADVFRMLAAETGHHEYLRIRRKAEGMARKIKEKAEGTREIRIEDIYNLLDRYYGIDKSWMQREMELEYLICEANPYILQVYNLLKERGKKLVFMTDMYLPLDQIKRMIEKCGYTGYEEIILSNEYKLNKGEGALQKVLMEKYEGSSIIHVGDNEKSDVLKSQSVGLDAFYNPASRMEYNPNVTDSITGGFYRAIISNTLNCDGIRSRDIYFEHGFRVGGILTMGYLDYIDARRRETDADKVIFCARDCEILYKIYTKYYEGAAEYLKVSRHAIETAGCERYTYDIYGRFLERYLNMYKNSKTVGQIFSDAGFDFLVPYLDSYDIDRFAYPVDVRMDEIERFFFDHKDKIIERYRESIEAAKLYFSDIIGDAKRLIVVDIGWSGTCIDAFRYFVEQYLPEKKCEITGVLMCTSRGDALKAGIEDGTLDGYACTPTKNMDLIRYMMSGKDTRELERKHMPLEYMYTSTEPSLIRYALNEDGSYGFVYSDYAPVNPEQIVSMQSGIEYFADRWIEHIKGFENHIKINANLAFAPFVTAIRITKYIIAVYKDFLYDAMTAVNDPNERPRFSSLYGLREVEDATKTLEKDEISRLKTMGIEDTESVSEDEDTDSITDDEVKVDKTKILFVTPELIYAGAPRSLLRMCKVAQQLGYEPVVWSIKDGPFAVEYQAYGISVEIVPENILDRPSTVEKIKSYGMAICNTIVTYRYEMTCARYIPTVWYIREATNIPDFINNNKRMKYALENSRNIYCVSDYAKEAISKFTDNPIHVIHNCVEDEVDLATDYKPGTGDKIKFVQFGTIEYRKGYDILLEAWFRMPEEYREKVELYFAGGMIRSAAVYASYVLARMKDYENLHFLGLVKGEPAKIETLSSMDVVVVASRDESCSLVALEGCMLSKPIIVTENVGAKYMVERGNDVYNGIVVPNDDPDALKDAMMYMVDHKANLEEYGKNARVQYEKYAGMDSYTQDMKKLYSVADELTEEAKESIALSERVYDGKIIEEYFERSEREYEESIPASADVVVSLTSHPARIPTVAACITSLIEQRTQPYRIVLWLSDEQFPGGESDLPDELVELTDNEVFEIRFVPDDMKPHKKYLYAFKEYPEYPIIIVDDDVVYSDLLVTKLMASYQRFPHDVSAMRTNLIKFKDDGNLRTYYGWKMEWTMLRDIPSCQLLPTGMGGVLYPPHSLPDEAFDMDAIKETCLFCDDLWLKIMTLRNGYRTVLPDDRCDAPVELEGTSVSALHRMNVTQNRNDVAMQSIMQYCDKHFGDADKLLYMMRSDRAW